jgi:hypothetical protein
MTQTDFSFRSATEKIKFRDLEHASSLLGHLNSIKQAASLLAGKQN